MPEEFDAARAWLREPDMFQRFVVGDRGSRLSDAGLKADEELIVAERDGSRRAFLLYQLSYHHMAQGELGGEPYLVSF